ncbi:MAG: amidohydrolase family protein [Deinococcota bacterium]
MTTPNPQSSSPQPASNRATSCQLLLRAARCFEHPTEVDIAIDKGHIVAVEPHFSGEAQEVWHLGSRVVLAGLIDLHVHLDKTLSMEHPAVVNRSGTLAEAIDSWGEVKPSLSHADYLKRATHAVEMAMCHGTTAMRSHVDVDAAFGLTALEAILEVRESYRDRFDLQVVVLGAPERNPQEAATVKAALEAGADVLGGAPGLFGDARAGVKACLDLAEQTGVPVDVHIDETDDPNVRALEHLAEGVTSRGLQGRVTAGHCCSLSAMSQTDAAAIIDKVAAAELTIVTLPSVNLVLQGRHDSSRTRRGLTRVKELLAAGVNVVAGSDNVQDPFNPFGNYDPMWIANLLAHAAHLSSDDERHAVFDLVTNNPARAFGKAHYGIQRAAPADLVVLDHHDLNSALAHMPARYAVLKNGLPYTLPASHT